MSGRGRQQERWLRTAAWGFTFLGILNLLLMMMEFPERGSDKPPNARPTTAVGLSSPRLIKILRPARRLKPSLRYKGVNTQGRKEFVAADGSVLIYIPASDFIGTRRPLERAAAGRSASSLRVKGFYIGKYEVTNAQFARFAGDVGFSDTINNWRIYGQWMGDNYPVVYLSHRAARLYCQWAGLRLPTVKEWERAARGKRGRTYPWGQEWDPNRCNNFEFADQRLVPRRSNIFEGRGPMPVGSISSGAAPCGAMDMVGNVAEWCADEGPPAHFGKAPVTPERSYWRALCGGSWDDFSDRCVLAPPISHVSPGYGSTYAWGFRMARSE